MTGLSAIKKPRQRRGGDGSTIAMLLFVVVSIPNTAKAIDCDATKQNALHASKQIDV